MEEDYTTSKLAVAADAILAEHWEVIVLVLAVLFLWALSRAVRIFQHRS